MSNIIHLLPDSVANQIAAGEVIQRPSSVVKEMAENAVDAGSTSISVNLKDAGKTLIQVIDNGCGMSAEDAELAFQRHATSKITGTNDLFAIRTLGFRGEALASVAAVAEVTLKTRRQEDELGTRIMVRGSEFVGRESVATSNGSNFLVKNLFYNVPARRRFLKSNSTELRHIIIEFNKIALAHPRVAFSLIHNNSEIHNLPASKFKQRIINLFGKDINRHLITLHTETNIVRITGYVAKPEYAKRKSGEQFFFVNNRYVRHPYLHKAVMEVFRDILQPEYLPSYFIQLEMEPEAIDINIHPAKTEVKFEDEKSIFKILMATIRESLGKFNIVPTIDFDREGVIDIPVLTKNTEPKQPDINLESGYNPFSGESDRKQDTPPADYRLRKDRPGDWETLYSGEGEPLGPGQQTLDHKNDEIRKKVFQLKNKYILTPVKSGLMIIDQKRAHERILFESFSSRNTKKTGTSQKNLYPQTVKINAREHSLLNEIIDDLCAIGFDIREFGKHSVIINGYPSGFAQKDPAAFFDELLNEYSQDEMDIKEKISEKVCRSAARASSIAYGKALSEQEMGEIIDNLFACETPNYSPSGKPVFTIMDIRELDKRLKV